MLRPATPLTILLLISFVFLLLSVLSTPVVKAIPLATHDGVNFGVFGYCKGSQCSGIKIGYSTNGAFGSDNDNSSFDLPATTRHSLSSLLVVHPVAAFMNLVCLVLAAAAHLHSPSHSARYLLGLLILLFPTLLITLLAFLVDILLFVPHLDWGGWIVLASVILITASGVVTCAMRRTLVSRKARKKRIAENAEMSGENFYSRQAAEDKLPPASTFSTVNEPKTPVVNGAPGADNLPAFATYGSTRRAEEDRQPLNRAPSNNISPVNIREDPNGRYYGPRSRSNSRPRDQYGNPMPPAGAAGAIPPMPGRVSEENHRRGPSPYRDNSVPPPRGPSPYRDNSVPPPRGGYGLRGRGGYPSRGGYPPRGGYSSRGPPPQNYGGRGAYATRGRGGYQSSGPMVAEMGGAMMAGGMMGGPGPRAPPPGYGPEGAAPNAYSPPDERENPVSPSIYSTQQGDQYAAYGARAQSPYGPRTQSPYGARAQSPGTGRQSPYGGRAQSPAGGVVRSASPPPDMPPLPGAAPAEMDGQGHMVSPVQEEYVAPRSAWAHPTTNAMPPAELPTAMSHAGSTRVRPHRVNSGGSDVYYEDVDPRFAEQPEPMPQQPQPMIPQLLHPGGNNYHDVSPGSSGLQPHAMTGSYEDLPGARSPAESETSNFTSVSQRGVNPNWRPGFGGEFNSLAPRKPLPQQTSMRRDVLLAGNPDFEIPGMGPPGRRARGGMRGGGMAGGGRMAPASGIAGMGLGPEGPYPRAEPPVMRDVREI